MMMAARALIAAEPAPDRETIEEAIGGVLCRCTGYAKIIEAIADYAGDGAAPRPAAGAAVGERALRLDGGPKVDGTEVFGADYWPADALVVRAMSGPRTTARVSCLWRSGGMARRDAGGGGGVHRRGHTGA